MPLTKKAGTRESKALSGRGAAAASDGVAYNGLSMRAGNGIVRAVAHGMRTICCGAGIYDSDDSRQRCVVHRPTAYCVVASFAAMLPIAPWAATSCYVDGPSDCQHSPLQFQRCPNSSSIHRPSGQHGLSRSSLSLPILHMQLEGQSCQRCATVGGQAIWREATSQSSNVEKGSIAVKSRGVAADFGARPIWEIEYFKHHRSRPMCPTAQTAIDKTVTISRLSIEGRWFLSDGGIAVFRFHSDKDRGACGFLYAIVGNRPCFRQEAASLLSIMSTGQPTFPKYNAGKRC